MFYSNLRATEYAAVWGSQSSHIGYCIIVAISAIVLRHPEY